MDIIIRDIQQRFQENNLNILNGLKEIIVNSTPLLKALNVICNTYGFDKKKLDIEIEVYNRMFIAKYSNIELTNIFKMKIEFMKNNDFQNEFPILSEIIKIFLTIPTTTASCERSFPCLKRLKTHLITTMNQERLSNLAILQIEKERIVNLEEIINEFNNDTTVNKRRLHLN